MVEWTTETTEQHDAILPFSFLTIRAKTKAKIFKLLGFLALLQFRRIQKLW